MSSHSMQQARVASVLVAITFHFDPSKVKYLADLLQSLFEFPVRNMKVIVLTNTFSDNDVTLLDRLFLDSIPRWQVEIRSQGNLLTPRHLAWCHKAVMASEFVSDSGDYTHFVYAESDIRLTFVNFCYWIEFREILSGFGLLPAFLRFEWNASLGSFTSSDAFWPAYVPVQSHLRLDDTVFVSMPNPYNPLFILDGELGREYIQSPSFDVDGSSTVCSWGLLERAAMGLCLENVPPPFPSRYVIPVDRGSGIVFPGARVWHLPNNYANNPQSPLGKVRMSGLILGVDQLSQTGAWASTPVSPVSPPNTLPLTSWAQHNNQEWHYLVSEHDTVVYFDEDARRLRHAPYGAAPLNLILEWRATRGRLLWLRHSAQEVSALAFSGQKGEMHEADVDFDINYYYDDTVSIRSGETYLGADLDSVVYNDRIKCFQWERYRLIRFEMLAKLSAMRKYSWVSHSDRQIVSLADQPFDYGREKPAESSALAATFAGQSNSFRRTLIFGPASFRLTDRDTPIHIDAPVDAEQGPPQRLSIRGADGDRHSFSRFAPLVRFVMQEHEPAFASLRPSLTSLERQGGYRGAICVVTDRDHEEILEYIPVVFHDRIILERPSTGHLTTERGDLEGDLHRIYQPILQCMPGTVFLPGLLDTLIDMLLENFATVSVEGIPISPSKGRRDGQE